MAKVWLSLLSKTDHDMSTKCAFTLSLVCCSASPCLLLWLPQSDKSYSVNADSRLLTGLFLSLFITSPLCHYLLITHIHPSSHFPCPKSHHILHNFMNFYELNFFFFKAAARKTLYGLLDSLLKNTAALQQIQGTFKVGKWTSHGYICSKNRLNQWELFLYNDLKWKSRHSVKVLSWCPQVKDMANLGGEPLFFWFYSCTGG